MPIYEYHCNECKGECEFLVYGNKEVECPKCGSKDMRKKMSLFGMSGSEKGPSSGGGGCSGCSKTSCSTC